VLDRVLLRRTLREAPAWTNGEPEQRIELGWDEHDLVRRNEDGASTRTPWATCRAWCATDEVLSLFLATGGPIVVAKRWFTDPRSLDDFHRRLRAGGAPELGLPLLARRALARRRHAPR